MSCCPLQDAIVSQARHASVSLRVSCEILGGPYSSSIISEFQKIYNGFERPAIIEPPRTEVGVSNQFFPTGPMF